MKSDIIYHDETLYVILEGVVCKSDLQALKHKMDYIINEYGIDNVIVDTTSLIDKNNSDFDIFNSYDNVIIKKL